MKLAMSIFAALLVASCASSTRTGSSGSSVDFRQEIDVRYDLVAMTTYLRTLLKSHPVVDGVSIVGTAVGQSWILDDSWLPVGLSAGDWTFQQSITEDAEFNLSHRLGGYAIRFRCRRDRRGVFTLLSVQKEKLVPVSVSRIKT